MLDIIHRVFDVNDPRSKNISAYIKELILKDMDTIESSHQDIGLFLKNLSSEKYLIQSALRIMENQDIFPDDMWVKIQIFFNGGRSLNHPDKEQLSKSLNPKEYDNRKQKAESIFQKFSAEFNLNSANDRTNGNIIAIIMPLTLGKFQERATVIRKNTSTLFTTSMSDDDLTALTAACLKLTSEQIHEIGVNIFTLFSADIGWFERFVMIETCLDLTPDQIRSRATTTALNT